MHTQILTLLDCDGDAVSAEVNFRPKLEPVTGVLFEIISFSSVSSASDR